MNIVVDTSALIAIIVDEPERDRIIKLAFGNSLIGPGSIPWEMGNAFSAMLKKNRITLEEAQRGYAIFESIPLQYTRTDHKNVLRISKQANIYAYDAYFLDCAIRHKAPLLTLDRRLLAVAGKFKVEIMEV